MQPLLAVFVVVALVIGYTAWVSVLVVRNPWLSSKQRWLQLVIAWLVPLLGALAVHLIGRAQGLEPKEKASGIEPQQDQGVDYASFTHHDVGH